MKTIFLILFTSLFNFGWSQNKLILTNDNKKVKVKIGYDIRIEMVTKDARDLYGSVQGFTQEELLLQMPQKIQTVDTIPEKDFNRKLKKEGWEIVDYPYYRAKNCNVIIGIMAPGEVKTIPFSEIDGLSITGMTPVLNTAYVIYNAGIVSITAAPFTGIRSDRYHWPSFFSSISGGFAAMLVGFLTYASVDDSISDFQNYQRELK
ncbi:MAG: hypothetical protein NXI10_11450 [bacterium]|nr:hypothetical protein [bacterium]